MSEHVNQSSEGGAPEWMVSYADMITIIMAFFVVLYASTSASGDKDHGGKAGEVAQGGKEPTMRDGHPGKDHPGGDATNESQAASDARMQRVLDSLYYRFGPDWTAKNCWTGGPPQLKEFPATPPDPDNKRLGKPPRGRERVIFMTRPKPNDNLVIGGRVFFEGTSASLTPEQERQLSHVAEDLAGKMQRIEVRGHTSRRPLPDGSPFGDHWDLAYARCRAVENYLVSRGIDARRLRLGVAGENEPFNLDGDPLKIEQDGRVEVRLLSEWVQLAADAAPASQPLAKVQEEQPAGTP